MYVAAGGPSCRTPANRPEAAPGRAAAVSNKKKIRDKYPPPARDEVFLGREPAGRPPAERRVIDQISRASPVCRRMSGMSPASGPFHAPTSLAGIAPAPPLAVDKLRSPVIRSAHSRTAGPPGRKMPPHDARARENVPPDRPVPSSGHSRGSTSRGLRTSSMRSRCNSLPAALCAAGCTSRPAGRSVAS